MPAGYFAAVPLTAYNAITAIQRALNFAFKQGLLASSPLASMEKPATETRDRIIEDGEWATIVGSVRATDPFKLILVENRRRVPAHRCGQSLGVAVEEQRPARAVEQQASTVGRRPHHAEQGVIEQAVRVFVQRQVC